MATATLSAARSEYEIEVNQRMAAVRRRREALEEMRANGIEILPEWEPGEVDPAIFQRQPNSHETPEIESSLPEIFRKAQSPSEPLVRALNCRQMSGVEDFVSRPDARPMTKHDICNVVALERAERRYIVKQLRKVEDRLPEVQMFASALEEFEAGTPNWRDDDERWSLSPHELKKLRAGKKLASK